MGIRKIKKVNMKKLLIVVIALLSPAYVWANCGGIPASPALLASNEPLTQSTLVGLEQDMEAYFLALTAHQECVDMQLTQLVPPNSDADEAYLQSDEYLNSAAYQAYESQYEALLALIDQVEVDRNANIAQFNQVLMAAVPDES